MKVTKGIPSFFRDKKEITIGMIVLKENNNLAKQS
jgi:hypothetical protein